MLGSATLAPFSAATLLKSPATRTSPASLAFLGSLLMPTPSSDSTATPSPPSVFLVPAAPSSPSAARATTSMVSLSLAARPSTPTSKHMTASFGRLSRLEMDFWSCGVFDFLAAAT